MYTRTEPSQGGIETMGTGSARKPYPRRALLCVAAAAIVALLPGAFAQSSAPKPGAEPTDPVFDVAAIRQNLSDPSARSHIVSSPFDGEFHAINVPLKMLLAWAFETPETRILDGPSWIGSTKFDIEAKADSSVDDRLHTRPSDQGRLEKQKMLQALLADRFRLAVHRESRQLPIYALVVAKGGPKFQVSRANGTAIEAWNGKIKVQGSDDTIALLCEQLARKLGRPVVDKTGIPGRYDLTLEWTPDEQSGPNATAADPLGPSLFTAIEEQLGLKLESEKGPVEVLVIEHVEMPSAN
jgi:uncharacterized protein (TIGR03435 family)